MVCCGDWSARLNVSRAAGCRVQLCIPIWGRYYNLKCVSHSLDSAHITVNQANTSTMTSLYQQTIPVSIKYLRNLSGLLNQAVKFADRKGMKHEEILTFRLIEDMLPVWRPLLLLHTAYTDCPGSSPTRSSPVATQLNSCFLASAGSQTRTFKTTRHHSRNCKTASPRPSNCFVP